MLSQWIIRVYVACARSSARTNLEGMKDAEPQFNWSIRLSEGQVAAWDDLMRELRRETGNRAVTKSDVVRTLLALAETPGVRRQLVRELRQLRRAS